MFGRKGLNRKANILIVDDDDSLLKFFKIHLTSYFSNISVVENVEAALKIMKEKEFELIISDIKLPKISGIEFLNQLKAADAAIPECMVSGYYEGTESDIIAADGFLKKPFDIDNLNTLIEVGLKKRKCFLRLKELFNENNDTLLSFLKDKTIPEGISEEDLKEIKKISKTLSDLNKKLAE